MDWDERMKKDWNMRAQQNAMHYILCGTKEWEAGSFFEKGERDVATFVDPFLAARPMLPRGNALDIGCGIGRLTKPLAKRFKNVVGVDVSEEMIAQARATWADCAAIEFMVNNGRDLSVVPSRSMDFIFSYIVLQHIPDPEIQYNYLRDIGRILRPGGAFLVQMSNSNEASHEAYKNRWETRRKRLASTGEVVPFEDHEYAYLEAKLPNYETLLQQPVRYGLARQALQEGGCNIDIDVGQGTDFLWIGGHAVI